MKTTILMLTVAVVAAAAPEETHTVTVCMEGGTDIVMFRQAEALATRMFAGVGVRINWRGAGRSCPSDAIVVRLKNITPATRLPLALASARPFEGTTIELFVDRIKSLMEGPRAPRLLAHVLVHEITHILQASDRHSDTGMMKARWVQSDYDEMSVGLLTFTEWDLILIESGLKSRSERQIVASND